MLPVLIIFPDHLILHISIFPLTLLSIFSRWIPYVPLPFLYLLSHFPFSHLHFPFHPSCPLHEHPSRSIFIHLRALAPSPYTLLLYPHPLFLFSVQPSLYLHSSWITNRLPASISLPLVRISTICFHYMPVFSIYQFHNGYAGYSKTETWGCIMKDIREQKVWKSSE